MKKRTKRISTVALSAIIVSLPLYNLSYALNNNTQNTASGINENTLTQDVGTVNMFGDLNNIENNTELLERYNLNLDDIKRINLERSTFTQDALMSDIFSDEQVKLMKIEFQNSNGVEDTFETIKDEGNIKIETNGFRGIIRNTVFDDTGAIESSFDVNYFEQLDKFNMESKEEQTPDPYATTIVPSNQFGTGKISSAWKPYIKVTRDTRDRIIISNKSGELCNYSKDKYNWNSGDTLKFYNSINSARDSWNGIANSMNATLIAKVIAYCGGLIALGAVAPAVAAVVAFLTDLGILGGGAIAIGTNIVGFIKEMITIENTFHAIK